MHVVLILECQTLAVYMIQITGRNRLWHKFKSSSVIYFEYSKSALNEVSTDSSVDLVKGHFSIIFILKFCRRDFAI